MKTGFVVAIVSMSGLFSAVSRAQCAPIQISDGAKLIDYVQKKYKTP
jgi:hypothetical protein